MRGTWQRRSARYHRQLQPVVSSSFLGFDSLFLHLILYPSLVLFLIICEFALKCDIRRIQERFRFPGSTASAVVLIYSMPTMNIDAPNKMHRMQIFGNFSRKERDRHTKRICIALYQYNPSRLATIKATPAKV